MRARHAFTSTVGTKVLIALTGVSLFGFLVFHLYGNLLLFWGPDKYNEHAHALISNPLVIPAELGLLAIFLLHAVEAVMNFLRNRDARPAGYAVRKWGGGASRKTWASTSMILTGLITLAFVALHLVTFKYGPYYAAAEPGVRDLYRLLIEVFRKPGYVVFYIVTMTVVGLHLRHGISSSLQSLGLVPDAWTRAFLRAGYLLALIVGGGFVLIPIWVYFFL
jgi:succinate dehydrogenase / fumarate reductase cytochrome b subunit